MTTDYTIMLFKSGESALIGYGHNHFIHDCTRETMRNEKINCWIANAAWSDDGKVELLEAIESHGNVLPRDWDHAVQMFRFYKSQP